MTSKIFISYSRKDLEIATRIRAEIHSRIGIEPWMDLSGIETGAQFQDVIINAIDGCDILLFFISKHSLDSQWARKEVMYAQATKKKIYPINIDSVELKGWFLFNFAGIDCIDYCNKSQYEKLFANLQSACGISKERTTLLSTSFVCPICGTRNEIGETFKCQKCGRDHICKKHQDKNSFLCSECDEKAVANLMGIQFCKGMLTMPWNDLERKCLELDQQILNWASQSRRPS